MRKSLQPLVLLILFSFNVGLARSEGLVENYEEVVDNVIFEYVFSDLPTFEEDFEKDLGVLGDITGSVYVSAGQAYMRLPARIITRYDTTLEPFSSNVVEMAVEPYNGEGPEFKLIFGMNLSVVYDPLGPSWLTGKASFGDFDTGFNFEGDFTPPIDGEWEATGSESFTGSIGLKKALSFDIGANVRFNVQGKVVKGSTWEDDPFAEIQDTGERGVALRRTQGTPQFTVKDNDLYTSLDYQVDFMSYDLYYVTAVKAEIESIIMGFSFMGASWTWEFPTVVTIESHEVDFTLWANTEESDNTTYQMTRVIAPGGSDYPFFDVSAAPMAGTPGQVVMPEIALAYGVQNPPSGYSVQPALLRVFDMEETQVASVTVSAADFQRGSMTLPLTLPSFTDQHYSYRLVLEPPDLSRWYGPYQATPRSATLTFSRPLPDLHPVRLDVAPELPGSLLLEHGSYVGALNIVEVVLENGGDAPSSATDVKLWLCEGLPSVPAFSTTAQLVQDAALIGVNPVPPLQPGGASRHEFAFLLPQELEDKVATYIIEIDGGHLVPEGSEENNRAFTTVEVQKTSQGVQFVLGSNHYAFSSLVGVFDVPSGQVVADMSEDIASRAEDISNEMLVEEFEALAHHEAMALEELEAYVPSTLLEAAREINDELIQGISEAQAAGVNDTAVLELLNIKTRFFGEVNKIWQSTVRGTVKEPETALIQDARVRVSYGNGDAYETHVTPVNGSFLFSYLPPGDAVLSASAPAYENYTEEVTLMPSGTINRAIQLTPRWGSLTLTVIDSDTEEPMRGAMVELDGVSSITGVDGKASFMKIRPGDVYVSVKRKGYDPYYSALFFGPAEHISEQALLEATRIHDVSVIALNVVPGTVSMGGDMSIVVTLGNEGMWTEDLELALYTNSTVIAEETLSLPRETYETRSFQWSAPGTGPARYSLSAYLTPVSGENETADNEFDYGILQVIDDEPPYIAPVEDEATTTDTEISLRVEASDNHEVSSIVWDMGDGAEREGEAITYTYEEPGNYMVTVTASDHSGNTAEDTFIVTVTEPESVTRNSMLLIGTVAALIVIGLIFLRTRSR
jgi:hypothetical protein